MNSGIDGTSGISGATELRNNENAEFQIRGIPESLDHRIPESRKTPEFRDRGILGLWNSGISGFMEFMGLLDRGISGITELGSPGIPDSWNY